MSKKYRKKCFDPFKSHKKTIIKSLNPVNANIKKMYNLDEKTFICSKCFDKISKRHKFSNMTSEDFSVLKDSSVNGTNSVLQRPYHVNEFISEKTCKFESSVCSHYVSFSKEKEKYHALEKEVGKLKESVNILKEENLSHKNENSHLKNKIKYLENLLSDSKSASEDNLGYQNYNEFTMRDINNECLVKEEVTEESDDNSEFFHSKFVANHSNEPPSDDINQCTVKKEDSEENSIYENHFNYPPCDVFDGIVVKKEELDY